MTDILFLSDCSLSVEKEKNKFIGMINSIIYNQQDVNQNGRLTLIKFNDRVVPDCIYLSKPFKDVEQLVSYDCSGMTALYRTINYCLESKEEEKLNEICIILTDGCDNASPMCEKEFCKEIIEEMKGKGMKFIFLGLDKKSIKCGIELGVNLCILYNLTSKSLKATVEEINTQIRRNVPIDDVIDMSTMFGKMSL
tara:strand:- start:178 stop:762 length:585 start_codon:yes stop_codon:yes gene_type:complete